MNSSKSRSTISGARGGQKSARSADASSKKLSQSRNQEGVPNVRGAKSNKQSERSGPSGRGGTTRRAEQSKGEQVKCLHVFNIILLMHRSPTNEYFQLFDLKVSYFTVLILTPKFYLVGLKYNGIVPGNSIWKFSGLNLIFSKD